MELTGSLLVVTPPSSEPVTLAEAKSQCRVDVSDDDDLITAYIQTAREYVEAVTRRALLTQTLELRLDEWPDGEAIYLPRPPVQSVESVTYLDEDGNEQSFDASNYVVDTTCVPARVVLVSGVSWPSDDLYPAGAVRVRYVAGWSSAGDVPRPIRQAILMLVGHWYENREATVAVGNTHVVPFAVDALLWSWRVLQF